MSNVNDDSQEATASPSPENAADDLGHDYTGERVPERIGDGPTASPVPASSALTFHGAVDALLGARRVRRPDWAAGACIYLEGGLLRLRKETGVVFDLILSEADMLATDWEVAA